MNEELENQRLDKWLWAARFYKTRALAAEAVSGGKVHLNGERVKPGRVVKVADQLQISMGIAEYDIVVLGLNKQRRPAREAQLLYQESEEGKALRLRQVEQNRVLNANMPHSDHRPNKKERRNIVNFKRQQNDS
ncbi:MAG: S4 domain-containing protein [Gammaproteobacteria bacterium]|nr:S4 domain-containing protein [Gammaproteobacteria bacterium]